MSEVRGQKSEDWIFEFGRRIGEFGNESEISKIRAKSRAQSMSTLED